MVQQFEFFQVSLLLSEVVIVSCNTIIIFRISELHWLFSIALIWGFDLVHDLLKTNQSLNKGKTFHVDYKISKNGTTIRVFSSFFVTFR